mmetsp:Transcript_9328/g.56850  ORF Transcript_9328/g.56850 Transcript_9328/m.56850 type:complete len:270 (+) Transcript_9328:169-978(+)
MRTAPKRRKKKKNTKQAWVDTWEPLDNQAHDAPHSHSNNHEKDGKEENKRADSRYHANARCRSLTSNHDRLEGQDPEEELVQRDLKAELEAKEREYLRKQGKLPVWGNEDDAKQLEDGDGKENPSTTPPDEAIGNENHRLVVHQLDADDTTDDDSERDSEKTEDSDEEDDTAALVAELERIKKERAEEAAKKAAEQAAQEEKEQMRRSRDENPLLDLGGSEASFAIKRRWDDDVVFRNQARQEKKAQKRFVNDTVRNDFHRRFLDKYIK